ncbi:MAG: hypothetical protein RIT45_620 [Pseudomonadota bacterium]|jgi:hypothetical protein
MRRDRPGRRPLVQVGAKGVGEIGAEAVGVAAVERDREDDLQIARDTLSEPIHVGPIPQMHQLVHQHPAGHQQGRERLQ